MNQRLEYSSGVPVILSPNTPAKLKNAKLDGRRKEIFKDRHGRNVQVQNLSRDYHLYVLVSRISSSFGKEATWNPEKKCVETELIFHTHPEFSRVEIQIALDGSSPYPLPSELIPEDIKAVSVAAYEEGGFYMGMRFLMQNGNIHTFQLSPDLLHFIKYKNENSGIADFKVEYVGISCGPNGNRNVFERARAHEKVVEIQGDLQQLHGNKSLYIFAYDPGYFVEAKHSYVKVMTTGAVLNHLIPGGENKLYEIMEACLIGYFKPKYNDIYSEFPDKLPKWADGSIYSINGPPLSVKEIATNISSNGDICRSGGWHFGSFYSDTVKKNTSHNVLVELG